LSLNKEKYVLGQKKTVRKGYSVATWFGNCEDTWNDVWI